MTIDEEGGHSLGSDHKRINLSFGKLGGEKTGRPGQRTKLNSKQIADIAKSIEADIERNPGEEWEYDRLIKTMQEKIVKAEGANRWRGKKKHPKAGGTKK